MVVSFKFLRDKISVEVWRGEKVLVIEVELTPTKPLCFSTKEHPAPYFIFGGLVFTLLSTPYIEDAYDANQICWGYENTDELGLILTLRCGRRETREEEVVILSRILVDECNQGYDFKNLKLTHVNDTKVITLQQVYDLCAVFEKQEFISFRFLNGNSVVLSCQQVRERKEPILARHKIPNDFSPPTKL